MSSDNKETVLSQHLRQAAKNDQDKERARRIDALQDKEARSAIDTIRDQEKTDLEVTHRNNDEKREEREEERRIAIQQEKFQRNFKFVEERGLTPAEFENIINQAKVEIQQEDEQRLNDVTARAESRIDRVLDIAERNTGRRLSKDEYLERSDRDETRRESFDRVSEGDRDADRSKWSIENFTGRSGGASTERSQDRDQGQERDRDRE